MGFRAWGLAQFRPPPTSDDHKRVSMSLPVYIPVLLDGGLNLRLRFRLAWIAVSDIYSLCTHIYTLRVQVPNNHILTKNLYYNYYYPNPKYVIIGYMDPLGYIYTRMFLACIHHAKAPHIPPCGTEPANSRPHAPAHLCVLTQKFVSSCFVYFAPEIKHVDGHRCEFCSRFSNTAVPCYEHHTGTWRACIDICPRAVARNGFREEIGTKSRSQGVGVDGRLRELDGFRVQAYCSFRVS